MRKIQNSQVVEIHEIHSLNEIILSKVRKIKPWLHHTGANIEIDLRALGSLEIYLE